MLFRSDLHTAVNAVENKPAFGRLDGWTADRILKGAGANVNPTEEHMNQSCKVYRTTSQSIPDSTWTAVAFDNEEWDTNNIHDNATNPNRLTCKVAGKYLVIAGLQWVGNTTGRRLLRIRQSGATDIVEAEATISAANPVGGSIATGIASLAVDGYLELLAYQTSGGALNTYASRLTVNFAMHRLVS